MSDRRPLVAGNWKMNTSVESGVRLAREVAGAASGESWRCDVGVFPPFVSLHAINAALGPGSPVQVGAQDVYHEPEGAFTGEVSCAMLQDVGCSMVLVGHSERRHVIGETDDLVARKTAAALASGLTCVLCVGETLEQREAGETDAVNERQVRSALAGIPAGDLERLVIAYEPVWAIGTGRTATPADAQAAHEAIRAVLVDAASRKAASRTRILYGGSMKPANAGELLACPDIDGGLIGGASLQSESFCAIARACP